MKEDHTGLLQNAEVNLKHQNKGRLCMAAGVHTGATKHYSAFHSKGFKSGLHLQ
jgi:hypothetical protein